MLKFSQKNAWSEFLILRVGFSVFFSLELDFSSTKKGPRFRFTVAATPFL